MKNNSEIILSLTLFLSLILNILNSEPESEGSTVYYSTNNKCSFFLNNQKICLENNKLKKNGVELSTITDYSESNYYELNLYKTNDDIDYIHCIIIYFADKNNLAFKYYHININTNNYDQKNYNYYDTSLKPFNKGINCQAKDWDYKFICFYFNKDKDIVKMDIKNINNMLDIIIDFQFGKINNHNDLDDGNIMIMSSLFKDKYKFHKHTGTDKFNISYNKKTEFNFSQGFLNEFEQKEFEFLIDGRFYAFVTFKNYKDEHPMSIISNQPKNNIFVLERDSIVEFKAYYPSDLYFTEVINIFIFRFKKEIDNYKYEYNSSDYNEETDNKINTNEIKHLKINGKIEDIIDNINQIMKDNVTLGETYEYQSDNYSVLIYPFNSKLLDKKTHIESLDCLSNKSKVTFFQIEILNENKKSLVNKVEYQAFDEQKNKIDLSQCNNSNIKILYGIKNNSYLDMSVVKSFKDSDINVFNISDEFFNDICYSYSENGNDLILEDRIKDIYQDFTLCEEGCYSDKIDINNMLVSCQCNIKENITTEIKEINDEKIVEKITSLNFEIIRCYNLVFSFKGKMKNYGFWILSIFFLFYFIFLISFSCNGIKPIKDYIFNEMTKFGYMNKNSSLKNNNFNSNGKRKVKFIETKNSTKTSKKLINPPKKKKDFDSMTTYKKTTNKSNKRIFISKSNRIINNIHITNQITNKKVLSFKKSNKNNKNNKDNNNKSIKNLDLNLISINLNNLSQRNISPKESNITLYNYTMKEAFKYDRRNIMVIFYIFLLSKEAFFHAFFYKSPLVLFPLRFCLLLFIISSDLALNAFFYFNDNISRKYRNTKNIFIFTLSNNMTVILLSTLITFIFLTLFTNLSNTTKVLRDVFKNEENKIRKNKNYQVTQAQKDKIKKNVENILSKYKCKILFLFFIEIILMLFFWYYTVVFCQVFSGTQISWLINSALSMLSRIIIDILLCFLFSKLYNIGVRSNNVCIYKIALFFYGF